MFSKPDDFAFLPRVVPNDGVKVHLLQEMINGFVIVALAHDARLKKTRHRLLDLLQERNRAFPIIQVAGTYETPDDVLAVRTHGQMGFVAEPVHVFSGLVFLGAPFRGDWHLVYQCLDGNVQLVDNLFFI